jgi:hypothetical protein
MASLQPFGTRAPIKALRRCFYDAMHVEEMWHPDRAAVSKIRRFDALQILRTRFLEESCDWRESSRSPTVWDVKSHGLHTA